MIQNIMIQNVVKLAKENTRHLNTRQVKAIINLERGLALACFHQRMTEC
jgi:hypothetical protein